MNLAGRLSRIFSFLCVLLLLSPLLPAKTSYKKWLNEEVVWIISKKERETFRELKEDGERDAFIENFWRRRDPTPSNERNEYQEEHYRRLFFASKAFREGMPGWKTDRGRIYILHGPPDAESFFNSRSVISPLREVESTERNPNTVVWVYHNMNSGPHTQGEMRLIFQPSTGLNRQSFALSDSREAQERADQFSRHFFPSSDPNWLEADVRYKLVMAGPPRLVNAKGAELPQIGLGEFSRYLEELLESPGDRLEQTEAEIKRREKVREELRTSSDVKIQFGELDFELELRSIYRPGQEWLVPLRIEFPATLEGTKRFDIYAAVLDEKANLFDEFIDTVQVYGNGTGSDLRPVSAYSNSFVLPASSYRLSVAVRDVETGVTGIREEELNLVLEGSKVRLGGVVLTSRLEILPEGAEGEEVGFLASASGNSVVYNGMRLLDNPSLRFYRGDFLFLFVQFQSVVPGSNVSLNANFIRDGVIVHRLDPRLIEISANYADYGTAIPTAGFEPGEYTLQLQALDHSSRNFDIRRVSFRVAEPLAE